MRWGPLGNPLAAATWLPDGTLLQLGRQPITLAIERAPAKSRSALRGSRPATAFRPSFAESTYWTRSGIGMEFNRPPVGRFLVDAPLRREACPGGEGQSDTEKQDGMGSGGSARAELARAQDGCVKSCGMSRDECRRLRVQVFGHALPVYRDQQEAGFGFAAPRQPRQAADRPYLHR
jgi:hypothetical protein